MLPSLTCYGSDRIVYLASLGPHDDAPIRIMCEMDRSGAVSQSFVFIDWPNGLTTFVESGRHSVY